MTAAALSASVGQAERLVGTRIRAHATAAKLEDDLRRQAIAGKRLRPLRHDQQFWFALAAFLPDAQILR